MRLHWGAFTVLGSGFSAEGVGGPRDAFGNPDKESRASRGFAGRGLAGKGHVMRREQLRTRHASGTWLGRETRRGSNTHLTLTLSPEAERGCE